MTGIFDAASAASLSSAPIQFSAFLILGLAVGWLLAEPWPSRSWSPALAIHGVCGAWLGGEAACLIGQVARGGAGQFLLAAIGAFLLAWAWRRFHPSVPNDGGGVAIDRSHA